EYLTMTVSSVEGSYFEYLSITLSMVEGSGSRFDALTAPRKIEGRTAEPKYRPPRSQNSSLPGKPTGSGNPAAGPTPCPRRAGVVS
ncbi:MAG TPA: hypothetical protein VGB25_06580, partial [Candidatus Binatia bacterium]